MEKKTNKLNFISIGAHRNMRLEEVNKQTVVISFRQNNTKNKFVKNRQYKKVGA